MNKKVLCDTNVWLDYYLGVRPQHASARQLISEGTRHGISFLIAVSSLSDFFYLCQADFKRALREAHGSISEARAAVVKLIAQKMSRPSPTVPTQARSSRNFQSLRTMSANLLPFPLRKRIGERDMAAMTKRMNVKFKGSSVSS